VAGFDPPDDSLTRFLRRLATVFAIVAGLSFRWLPLDEWSDPTKKRSGRWFAIRRSFVPMMRSQPGGRRLSRALFLMAPSGIPKQL